MKSKFTKKITIFLIFVFTFVFNNTAFSSDTALKSFAHKTEGTKTLIQLTFNKPIEYHIFMLSNPYRLVIDSTKLKNSMDYKSINKGAIKIIQGGQFSPNVTRTVIHLKYPVKIYNYKKDGKKLMVNIEKSSAKNHKNQKSIKSKAWNALEKRSKSAQRKEIEKISKPIAKAGKPLIIIDAGHGGPDPGSIGVGGHYEKHITLAISKVLYAELKKSKKFNVGMTRTNDKYIPLRTRYRIAERRQADFFISIHADKHRKSSVRGMSIYTLSDKASDREAAKLARKENAFDEMVGQSPLDNEDETKGILIDLNQSEAMYSASKLSNSLIKIAKKNKIRTLRNPHRFAGFAVLKSPNVPSILIETGYMSNKYDIQNLRSKKWKSRFAKSVRIALEKYFKEHPIKN